MKLFTKSKKRLSFILFIFISFYSFGQIGNPVQIDAFPPSPTPSSLGKFANIPVSTYTGTPNISIPIWDVKEGNIKLPISLNYHASGILVDEVASWVGLGWSLQAGGIITRSVRGLPDDAPTGFLNSNYVLPTSYTPEDKEKFLRYAEGTYDSQPDLFTFNFAGKSGNFQLDQQGEVYIVPFQKIKFEYINESASSLGAWNVTTEDGYVYRFDVREKIRSFNLCSQNTGAPSPIYISTWYLASITSPTNSTVTFEYASIPTYEYPIAINETNYEKISQSGLGGEFKQNTYCIMNNEVTEGKRLSKIKFSGGEIEFIATNSRWDLTGNNPGDKSLDYILIKNHTGTVIRKFKFNYKFMYENSLLNAPVSGYVNSDATKYRLTLTSVQEFDALEKNSKPPYKFDYILGLPKRLSKAVDFWGFYNGKTTNTTLIPAHVNASGVRFEGADRNPSILHAQKGTLNKITYPTGGFTDFYYEINEANRGLPKTRPGSATLNSDVWNGVWNKTQQKVSFEINSVGGDGVWVLLDLSQLPCGKNNQPYNSCGMFVGISTDINGNLGTQIFNSLSISDLSTKKIYLPNGKYFLHVGLTPSDNINTTYNAFSFILNWEEMTGEINDHDIGGIRLAKMIDTDPILNKTITKNYEYKIGSPTGLSSGRVSYLPLSFNYRFQSEKMHTSVLYTEYGYTLYDVYSSTPNVPLTYTQGAVVGYKEVTVYYEESNGDKGINGKTIYKYTSPEQFPDLGFLNGFPFPHVETRDWQRGLLLESIDYKRVGTGYIPVKKTTNTYFMNDEHSGNPNIKNNIGLKVGFSTSGPLTVVFNYQYYNFHTGYVEKTSSLETFYNSDGTQESSKTTKYQYSTDHLMPIKISNNTSDGSWLTSINTYPSDYSNTSGEIYQLKNANILNVPIEEVVIKSDNEQGTNSRIISGKLTSYTWYPAVVGIGGYPDRFYKYKEYYLETATPIASSNFQFSSRSTSNLIPPAGATSLFYQNPLYKERVIYNFSGEKGNINTYTQDGYKVSILWGYNNSLPIAKVINADRYSFFEDRTVQTDCLYNGFESGISPGEAGWYNFDATKVIIDKNTEPDNVHSGRYSVKLNPAPTGGVNYGPVCDMIPINQKVKYKLSCWIKTPIGFPANSAALNMYTMEKNKCCDAYPAVSANNSYLTISPTNNEWKYIETIINTDNYPYYTNEFVLRTYALNYSNTHPLYIDDIRIHPVDAQMETYNYDTQVGVSSTISPDNKLNIYEYDSLGRLLNIKDQNGNIIKSFNYIYGNK